MSLICAAVIFCGAGCNIGGPRSVDNADPAVKIRAMKRLVREHDVNAARKLVAELDSDDPAVRLYAIEALERLTGERFEYQYYFDEEQRKPSVERWQQWLGQAGSEQRAHGGEPAPVGSGG